MKSRVVVILTLCLLVLGITLAAQDDMQKLEEMPPMGMPEQMKHVHSLEGTWDVAMQSKFDMESDEWGESNGTCTYEPVLDGCAMKMHFTSTMPGPEMEGKIYEGTGLQTYDRETDTWQFTWTDNMMARQVLYTGAQAGDTLYGVGTEYWNGVSYKAKIYTFNHQDDSFDWEYAMSMDDGKTWMVTAKAKYTRQK